MNKHARQFNKYSPTLRWTVLLLGLSAIVGGSYFYCLKPLHAKKAQLDTSIEQAQKINQKIQGLINKDSHFVFENQLLDDKKTLAVINNITDKAPGVHLDKIEKLKAVSADKPSKYGIKHKGKNAQEEASMLPSEVEQFKNLKLFKHPLRIQVSGDFNALLNYLKAIEQASDALFWDAVHYKVKKHPKASMTLIVHTLSDEEDWIDA